VIKCHTSSALASYHFGASRSDVEADRTDRHHVDLFLAVDDERSPPHAHDRLPFLAQPVGSPAESGRNIGVENAAAVAFSSSSAAEARSRMSFVPNRCSA
jgi:hypothetical protein